MGSTCNWRSLFETRKEHGRQINGNFAGCGTGGPLDSPARSLMDDAVDAMFEVGADPAWPWPEPRLYYANALLPDAMMAAGVALDRPALVSRGLHLLGWLLERETRDGHLSVTPASGSGPDRK